MMSMICVDKLLDCETKLDSCNFNINQMRARSRRARRVVMSCAMRPERLTERDEIPKFDSIKKYAKLSDAEEKCLACKEKEIE